MQTSSQDPASAPGADQRRDSASSEAVRSRPRPSTSSGGRTGLGRSGPRSRSGCVTCKQRRVRCDEVHPVCGHCTRLQLVCTYKRPTYAQRWRQQPQAQASNGVCAPSPSLGQASAANLDANTDGAASSGVQGRSRQRSQPCGADVQTLSAAFAPSSAYPRSGYATPTTGNLLWSFDLDDIFSGLDTSWAGETLCMLPEGDAPVPAPLPMGQPVSNINSHSHFEPPTPLTDLVGGSYLSMTQHQFAQPAPNTSRPGPMQRRDTMETAASSPPRLGPGWQRSSITNYDDESARLIQKFRKIVQPPAAILIGGFERWRRLQHYLCQLSDHSGAVRSSLLCVIELLMMDEADDPAPQDQDRQQHREAAMKSILDRHAAACDEIQSKIAKQAELKPKTREHLLAAIFLLSWFEVIRDQDAAHSNLFPRHLADVIIVRDATWSRYSQQLLSWLNTLDSKASHLGGQNLLSPKCLEIVSHFPTQITSSLDHGGYGKDKEPEDSEFAFSDMSPGDISHSLPDETPGHQAPSLSVVQVKQVMLHTILQPALEWYHTSQSYCRRIRAHDKHHRRRFTSDDEYEVITACKQLERGLIELWDYRPAVISLSAAQLAPAVSPDMAVRLEEIFSVYLASFWILFVYLHRVAWWNLPLSALAMRALDETWRNLRRSYGEELPDSPLRKVIHPSLLWPLFLFGSECPDHARRMWVIEELEALGEAKPVLQSDGTDAEMLPPFRLSSGATRNAKRAAALLVELIREQEARQARVDDRDLSMRMFGCYFSIV